MCKISWFAGTKLRARRLDARRHRVTTNLILPASNFKITRFCGGFLPPPPTGIGVSCGSPADGMSRDQSTNELFYRFQLTQYPAVTPDVQLIVNSALNSEVDTLLFFGVRLRVAF